MGKTEEVKVNITSRATHRGVEKSMTLNRRYVKRPTKLVINEKSNAPRIEFHKNRKISVTNDEITSIRARSNISHIGTKIPATKPAVAVKPAVAAKPAVKPAAAAKPITAAAAKPAIKAPKVPLMPNPYKSTLSARRTTPVATTRRVDTNISSRQLKDMAIKKALAEMETQNNKASRAELREERIAEKVMLSEMRADKRAKKTQEKATRHIKKRHSGRIILAFATSSACVLALAAVVKFNLPNISVKVAAAQTGVEANYPNYIPSNFNLSGVYTNDKNSVIIEFKGLEGAKFTLAEEKSAWDSNALLANYVKGAYGETYDTIREQNVTIYVNHSNASWVKSGTFYKLTADAGVLSKRQIKNIVNSL